jgi:hypothetical protein
MKLTFGLFCAAACLFLSAPQSQGSSLCATSANLVANCGFETGDFTSWTLAGNDVPGELNNLYGVEGTDPFPLPGGTAPNSGLFQAYFADQNADPTTLSQVLSTGVGGQYTITFYLAQELVGPGTVNNSVVVTFGGTTLTTMTDVAVQGYTRYSFTATATSPTTTLSLRFGNDVGEFLLDDVQVQSPEPATWGLMLFAGLALFLGRRKFGRAA